MRVAIVHDWLTGMRGGERVLEVLCRLFPDAPIYTLIHRPERVSPTINAHTVKTSWLQRLPGVGRYYRWLLPLMPWAVAGLRPQDVDVVVSLSHCVAKGAAVPPGVPHLCYCFTPMRYIWDRFDQYIGSHTQRRWLRPVLSLMRPPLQRWDRSSARHVTRFVAISRYVAGNIERFYGRKAGVIYPPVDTAFFKPLPASRRLSADYYLVVSALVPYKRIDIAIRAANMAGFPLKVVGVGPEWGRLCRLAGRTVEMLGWVDDQTLRGLYQNCRALLFVGEEDFGLVPVEAQACGRPVIILNAGGAPESVKMGETAQPFFPQAPEALVEALRAFEQREWDPRACREQAMTFSCERFAQAFRAELEHLLE